MGWVLAVHAESKSNVLQSLSPKNRPHRINLCGRFCAWQPESRLYGLADVSLLRGSSNHVRAEEGVDIVFVKSIVLVAEIAVHRDAAFRCHHTADFLAAQHQQHIADFAA